MRATHLGFLVPVAVACLAAAMTPEGYSATVGEADDDGWQATIGGLHLAADVSVSNDGELWASGSAIAKYDRVRGVWSVTDWARGYAVESLEIDRDGSGWAILNPSESRGEFPPPGVPTSGLAELRAGRITYIEPFTDVRWTDIALTPGGDFVAVGFDTGPVFMRLEPDSDGWLPMPHAAAEERGAERLFSVTMLSDTLGFAASSPGAVWAWDGAIWSLHAWAPLEVGMGVWDIGATSAMEVWVVGGEWGSGQFAARLDGQEWHILSSTWGSPAFLSIALAGPGDGWIVGTFGGVYRMRLDTITPMAWSSPAGIGAGLRAVEYAAPGVVIAAGDDGQVVTASDHDGVVFHTEWSGPGMFFSGLITSDGTVWLGGAQCPGVLCENDQDTWLARAYFLRDGIPVRDRLPELRGVLSAFVEHDGDLYGLASVSASGIDRSVLLRRYDEEWEALWEIDDWYPVQAASIPGVGLLVLARESAGESPLDSALILLSPSGALLDFWEFDNTHLYSISVLKDYGVFAAGSHQPESAKRAVVLHLQDNEWIESYPDGSAASSVVGASETGLWVFVGRGLENTAYVMDGEEFKSPVDIEGNDGLFTRAAVMPEGLFVGSENGSVVMYDGEAWSRAFALSNQQWSSKMGHSLSGWGDKLIFVGEPGFVIERSGPTPTPGSTMTPTVVVTATTPPTDAARVRILLPVVLK